MSEDMLTDGIIARRNISALYEQLKKFEIQRQEDYQRVRQLQETVSQLTQQVQKSTIDIALIRAKSLGNGPTT